MCLPKFVACGIAAMVLAGSIAQAQSLAWSARYDSGETIAFSEPVGRTGVQVDREGNTYVLTSAYNGTYVFLLAKYAPDGTLAWRRTLSGGPLALALDERDLPLVLMADRTTSYDAGGTIRWQTDHLTGGSYLFANAFAPAPGGGAYVVGSSWSVVSQRHELAVLRLDASGQIAWVRAQGAAKAEVYGEAVGVDDMGRVYAAGRRPDPSVPGMSSFLVVAFDLDGSPAWVRDLPETYYLDHTIFAVDRKGGALISFPGGAVVDFHTVKFDRAGAVAWTSDFDGSFTGFGAPSFAVGGPDGTLCIVGVQGNSPGSPAVVCYDPSGGGWAHTADSPMPGLAIDSAGSAITTWALPSGLRVVAYTATGAIAWSRDQSWSGGIPPGTSLVPAGVAVGLSGQIRVDATRLLDSSGGVHLTLAYDGAGNLEWGKEPPPLPATDWARSTRFDPSGNVQVLATGFVNAGYRDLVRKYDPSGSLLWSRQPFDGPSAFAYAATVGPAGESFVVGSTAAGAPAVVKLDPSGTVDWTRSDLPSATEPGAIAAVEVDARGDVYVAGWVGLFDTRLFVLKYSTAGQLLWSRTDSTVGALAGQSVLLALTAQGAIAAGTVWVPAASMIEPHVWAVDSGGTDVWNATGGTGQVLTALATDSSGDAVVATAYPGSVYKFGAGGALLWSRSQDAAEPAPGVNAVSIDLSDDAVIVAYGGASGLEKYSAAGEHLWTVTPPGSSYCASLAPRPGGGFFAVGGYVDDLDFDLHGFLTAYDPDGQLVWSRNAGSLGGGTTAVNFLSVGPGGRVAVAGYTYAEASGFDMLAQVVVDEPRPALSFYTLPPCRALDTRQVSLGGPQPFAANTHHEVPLAGKCGVPPTARAVALNLTATEASSAGHVLGFAAGHVAPVASAMNQAAGRTRASQAVLELGDGGKLALRPVQASGSVHLIIDVAGYFE